jgi:hypothetical protein
LLTGLLVGASRMKGQTRAAEDARNPLRRCPLARAGQSSRDFAVCCAEWFVERQGYTSDSSRMDTSFVVSEGIEWAQSKREWLWHRRSALEPRAIGVCVERDGRYDVAFWGTRTSGSGRGVSMDSSFGSLRVHHADFKIAVLRNATIGCRQLRN